MQEKISEATNALNWFEIPVTDTTRAKQFYESVLDIPMNTVEMMGMEMTMFPGSQEGSGHVSGALVKSEYHTPSGTGVVVYLNANPNIQEVLDRVEDAGGSVIMPRTLINEQTGYFAFFRDSEGNRVGLHAGN
jgi:predicted enzyme related to lactoylglutathione lyase